MSVWYAIPSARSQEESTVREWTRRGYRTAVWNDPPLDKPKTIEWEVANDNGWIRINAPYRGYAVAVNGLVEMILREDPEAEWIVTGGDDISPDVRDPQEIAAECTAHFGGTFGVMQPTGDRWGADPANPNYIGTAYADRVCGSPWMGREWCRRAHGGLGPLWHEFTHMFVDEALQEAAVRAGVLWQRPDLTHMHHHWARSRTRPEVPVFLQEANSQPHWRKYKALLDQLKKQGEWWRPTA
jgi:hypothetical protein